MIKSITFTGGKDDYIDRLKYKDVPKMGVSRKRFEEIGERHHHRGMEYESVAETVEDGFENPLLQTTIKGRKFEFCADKVNILFGPNASGKTTVIKTIASHCLCGNSPDTVDGFTSLTKYIPKYSFHFGDDDVDYNQELLDNINRSSGNMADVVWDGAGVFYENHDGRITHGMFGDMIGGIISNGVEEAFWHMSKSTTSAGQKTLYIANKLLSIVSSFKTTEELIEENKFNRNKYDGTKYTGLFDAQVNYYNNMIGKAGGRPEKIIPTIMLDEMDKSLDLLNVISLYSDFFPGIMKKFGCQIIAVSHSPIILCDGIFNSEYYNIISMDDEYTNKCRENLKKIL